VYIFFIFCPFVDALHHFTTPEMMDGVAPPSRSRARQLWAKLRQHVLQSAEFASLSSAVLHMVFEVRCGAHIRRRAVGAVSA
jgi:hypothetical protein